MLGKLHVISLFMEGPHRTVLFVSKSPCLIHSRHLGWTIAIGGAADARGMLLYLQRKTFVLF
jgi:hypothetical protein